MNLSIEHVLVFVLVVCVFYYLMGNRCIEGVGGEPICSVCASALVATGATAFGIDEIPFVGEVTMAAEGGTDLVACSICGVDVGHVIGCMKAKQHEDKSTDVKMCECAVQFCDN